MATPAQVGAAGQAAGGIGGLIGSPPGGGGQQFLAPQQLPFLEQLFGGAAGLLEGGQLGQVAGFTPDQLAAFQGTRAAAAGLPQFTGQAQRALGGLFGGGGPFGTELTRAARATATDPFQFIQSPLVQRTIEAAGRPLIEQFQEEILPGIRGGDVATGQFGGSRGEVATGIAAGKLGKTLGDISTGITGRAFETGVAQRQSDLDRALRAAGLGTQAQQGALSLASSIAGLGFLGPQALAQQGGLQQALAQQQLEAPFRGLSQFQQLIGPPITLQEQFPQAGTGIQGLLGEGGLLEPVGDLTGGLFTGFGGGLF